ncbi:Holliday junction branch migration protein RuvA [Candidatus Uhrbacteria bacterium]|nr:Holliday junction branch migration protein RuvA [Candidatus Uhrbacteria bacterium]
MLAFIQGTIIFLDVHSLIVRAGDLGYRIFVTDDTRAKSVLGEDAAFFLHQHIRENTEELYGFVLQEEYELFEHLLSVSGVGPKSALAVLRVAPAQDIMSAIASGDAGLLKKVAGIGTKTAERIVLELKQAFQDRAHGPAVRNENDAEHDDLVDALMRLGCSRAEARSAILAIPPSLETLEEKLTCALRCIR